MGRRPFLLTVVSIPAGIAVGFFELGLGLVLQDVLALYGLIAPGQPGTSLAGMTGADPRLILLGLAGLVAIVRFASFILPLLTSETFGHHVRDKILTFTLGSIGQDSLLSTSEVTHILSNLIPRGISAINLGIQIIVGGFTALILIAGMVKISPTLAGIALGLQAAAALFLLPGPIFLQRAAKRLHERVASFTHLFVKDIRHLFFLRIAGIDRHEQDVLRSKNDGVLAEFARYYRIHGGISVFPFFVGVCFVILIIELNTRFSFIASAAFVPFVYFLHRLSSSAAQIASAVASAIQVAPFLRELYGTVGACDTAPMAPVHAGGSRDVPGPLSSLRVEELTIGRQSALVSGLNFSVGAGDVLLLSGESGCGKTTLLMTLVGLVNPIGGTIRWNGVAMNQLDPISFRQRTSYIGPDPYLFSGTIRENLMFGVEGESTEDQRIHQALWCACADFVHQKDGGLSATIGEDGAGLSAGQRQRLSIARAVLRRPEFLLLDEATANIDVDTEGTLMQRLRETLPKTIFLAVSHRASMRAFATQHLVLSK